MQVNLVRLEKFSPSFDGRNHVLSTVSSKTCDSIIVYDPCLFAFRGAALQKFADRIGVQFKVQVEVGD